jgi:hypothetical protein
MLELLLALSLNLLPLECRLYDLATDQILASEILKRNETQATQLTITASGVTGIAAERPYKWDSRWLHLKISNTEGLSDEREFEYTDEAVIFDQFPPYLISEIPGAGDTVLFFCRLDQP